MAKDMGLGKLNAPDTCFKRKYRFYVRLDEEDLGDILPPSKSARPTVSFKEMEAQHLNETIYFPGKPDWKPITITLHDIQHAQQNRVWQQLIKLYDPESGDYFPSCAEEGGSAYKFKEMKITMLDGCGNSIETWIFENPYFQEINWNELDMGVSDIMYIDLTVRYDRAYVVGGD